MKELRHDGERVYKVYKITSPNGKVYIGMTKQTLKRRFERGRGYRYNTVFYNDILKYGWDNFSTEVLFDDLDKETASDKEAEMVAKFKSNVAEFGYNLDSGGKNYHNEATKEKIRLGNKGKYVSQETRNKLSQSRTGLLVGEKNPFYGKHHTEETKRKHSEFMKGNQYNKGHHHTEEFKHMKSQQMREKYSNGGNPNCKKVYQYDADGRCIAEYVSASDAARQNGKSQTWMHHKVNDPKCKEWSYEKRT